jgi:hypothetical protein
MGRNSYKKLFDKNLKSFLTGFEKIMSKYPENRMTSFKGLNTLKAVFVQI